MRGCKCKLCKNKLTTDVAFKVSINNKNVYFCDDKHYEEYIQEQKEKELENLKWHELYDYVRLDVLKYESTQSLPSALVNRLQDLRNGTLITKGLGRVTKSKEGYPYDVILKTFKNCFDVIEYISQHKNFDSESQKINYIMAIINNKINDEYLRWKREQLINEQDQMREVIVIDLDRVQNIRRTTTEHGIGKFLDEDDF